MNYEGILEFKGTWRNYQARVLEHADRYMSDGKIHIVAAPGSGKTTLGIELIRRMNGKALILAPSITIREQWIAWYISSILEMVINILSGQWALLPLKLGYLTNTTYGYIQWSRYIKTHQQEKEKLLSL